MSDKELQIKEVLTKAADDMIEFSKTTSAPIDDVVYQSHFEENEMIKVYVLFPDIEGLKKMEEDNLKDRFMEAFIRSVAKNGEGIYDAPRLSFEFSVNI